MVESAFPSVRKSTAPSPCVSACVKSASTVEEESAQLYRLTLRFRDHGASAGDAAANMLTSVLTRTSTHAHAARRGPRPIAALGSALSNVGHNVSSRFTYHHPSQTTSGASSMVHSRRVSLRRHSPFDSVM